MKRALRRIFLSVFIILLVFQTLTTFAGPDQTRPDTASSSPVEEEPGTEGSGRNSGADAVRRRLEETGIFDISVEDINIGTLWLPIDPEMESDLLAMQLLAMGSAQNAEDTASLFASSGFEVLKQVHYDKDIYDPSHTCAFTIGKGRVMKGLFATDALLVSIRGTNGGEWYSNFDFCPSHSDEALAAENFLYASGDIFSVLKEYIDQEKDALIILCGHSRGAACANLLGLLVNEYTDPSRVYVYTFASPATIREGSLSAYSANIFNFINSADIFPMLPPKVNGFIRAGTDIILDSDKTQLRSDEERYIHAIGELSTSISAYYNDRHALDRAGLSEMGITAFEALLAVSDAAIKALYGSETEEMKDPDLSLLEQISQDSDLYSLIGIYGELAENDFEKAVNILLQHLPTAYMELLQNRGSAG